MQQVTFHPAKYVRTGLAGLKAAIYSLRSEGLAGLLGLASFLCGLAILIIRGCFGYGRHPGQWGEDLDKIHKGGQLWLSGQNPYADKIIEFAYPPHASSLTAFLGSLSFQHAWWLILFANLVALFGIFALYLKWFRPFLTQGRQNVWWPALVGFAYVMASNFTTTAVFFSAISIPIYFSIAMAWYFVYEKKKPYVAGIFLAFGSIKPQTSLFLCLFLLLDRQWRTLLVAAIIALCMSLPAMIQLGPIGCFGSWLDGIRAYSTFGENIVGGGGVITFDSALTAFGASKISVKFLGILGFLLVFAYRRHFSRNHLLVVLPFLSLTFIYSHEIDYIAISLMWLCLFETAARNFGSFITLALFALVFFLPSKVMQETGSTLLTHWRLFAITAVFVAYMLRVPVFSAVRPNEIVREPLI